jgi:hypothetical protein
MHTLDLIIDTKFCKPPLNRAAFFIVCAYIGLAHNRPPPR